VTGVGVVMVISSRVKLGLIFGIVCIVLTGFSFLLFEVGEGEWDNPECEGGWNFFNDCEYEQTNWEKTAEDFGCFFLVVAICVLIVSILMFLSAALAYWKGEVVDFVPTATATAVIEDEFAELESELDLIG
jgi:hypothetical protein